MGCDHNCSSCGSNCSTKDKSSFIVETNKRNTIKKIIAIHSGKGGVGKSFVTCMLANVLAKKGYKVGILDADITGPSVPTAFGIEENLVGDGEMMFPAITENGIRLVSINLLIDDKSKPVAWRGPVLGGAIKQFYQDVLWEEIDFLLVDMPPGTGDVALTVFQSLPVDGVVIVSTPQDLVSMIVGKAVNLAKMMDINVIGLVENMAYMKCPCCGNPLYPFGPSKLVDVANEFNINALASLPIEPSINQTIDKGLIETIDYPYLDKVVEKLESLGKKKLDKNLF
ncbi:MAG: Mrp/NBP35 family ATP-binding protein [Acholeplasmatales bacterium]|nr:Mrp/NBP35 family ATP-binding protein [Acholeplasmatales bacterium]